ncbi:hypothetical protein HUJ05_001546 [Dendroctonus ponderosae]|nr:hypothetical protein HUJ05_001546 [Dendroctonus ponderosae]
MGNESVSIMETESIKSENSSRSRRSRSHRDRNNFRQHSHRSTRIVQASRIANLRHPQDQFRPYYQDVTVLGSDPCRISDLASAFGISKSTTFFNDFGSKA